MIEETQPLVPQKSQAVSRPWGRVVLGVAVTLAVSAVAVRTTLGEETPSVALLAAASDSSDVFGCGCPIQHCCDNKDLYDFAFLPKDVEPFKANQAEDPCAILSEPIINRGKTGRDFNSTTICAEVDAGTRDGESSVCDQPEMFLKNQDSQTMWIVEFGKSCADGPSCEGFPGTFYMGNYAKGPVADVTDAKYWTVKSIIKGTDATTGTNGTVTVAACDPDYCVPGLGRPVVAYPGEYDGDVHLCDVGNFSGYVGPYDEANAYGTCVDFTDLSGNGTGAKGRVLFTDLAGNAYNSFNGDAFADSLPDCVDKTPGSPTPQPTGHKKSDGAASTTAAVALFLCLLAALLAY